MYKIVLYLVLVVVWSTMLTLQTDEEVSVRVLFESKRAINRAAHAAAQQLDKEKLADGIISIDEGEAYKTALEYLRHNLRLDHDLDSSNNSLLNGKVTIMKFEVINEDEHFPYTYEAPEYQYEVTLQRPGVILIASIHYARAFSMLSPIEWKVKGASELVIP